MFKSFRRWRTSRRRSTAMKYAWRRRYSNAQEDSRMEYGGLYGADWRKHLHKKH